MLRKSINRTSFINCSVLLLTFAAFSAILGCGGGADVPPGRERVSASGKVTFDGNPVPAGGVSFMHKESGNTGYCTIVNGAYTEEDGQGPVVGENTMSVTGLEMVDGKPLWGGNFSKDVVIGADGFKEDMAILSADVQPPASDYIDVDAE
jgi:hypothetical protein